MNKTALITGITGQTGSYLAEHLLKLGYKVTGLVRRSSEPNLSKIQNIVDSPNLSLVSGDLTDSFSLFSIIEEGQFDEIYNMGAMSHVWVSFKQPQLAFDTIVNGSLGILEAVRLTSGHSKVYLASSSEMWGSNGTLKSQVGKRQELVIDESLMEKIRTDVTYKELWTIVQDEDTPFAPNSPYAVAKLASHNLGKVYRDSYGIFVSSGILHNHESPRRGSEFVTQKVIKFVGELSKNPDKKLHLGNLSAYRDWGYAKEYAEAIHLILNHNEPDDFVISTGEAHSVQEFVEYAFDIIGKDWKNYVAINSHFYRPCEVPFLQGDSFKAFDILNWRPHTKFKQLVELMYEATQTNKI